MTEETKEIYRQLYIQTTNTLSENGKAINCPTESFVASVGVAPKKIDMEKFSLLKGKDYLCALYLSCFQKLPSFDAMKTFNPKTNNEASEIKETSNEAIVNQVTSEGAFVVRGLELVNSPYGKVKISFKNRLLVLAAGVKNSMVLRKIAKKMPQSLQKKIRGTFT